MQATLLRPPFPRGFTLVEALVALVIAGVLLCIVVPSFQNLTEGRQLEAAAAQMAADVQLARTEATARNEAVRISFNTSGGESCYVVHTGTAAGCACSASQETPECRRVGAQAIKTVRWSAADHLRIDANVDTLLFDPLHGTATPAGTLKVLGLGGRAVHHVVNVMGRIRSCSPWGLVPGYPRC
jgi:type IV fimbrial biogenesis protein FimT